MASNLEYKIEHLGHHHGQSDMELGLYMDGEIMGVVQYTLFNGELTVSDILVRPEYRRQGFGSRMMKYIKQSHPEYKYVPSMKTDLGAKFVHKDISIDEVRKIVREALSENLFKEETNISDAVRLLTTKYNKEYGVSCDMINQGDCENFAEELHDMLKEVGIDSEILSDGLFFDPFGDLEDDMMWDVVPYGNKPENFSEVGLPSHYWIYVGGKHYDSDAPEGVNDMFELPIIKNFYLKKSKIKEGQEVEGINDKTKLSIFDFDKTLVNTPEQETGMPYWEQKTGQKWKGSWWENPNSLDASIFEMSVNPSVISAYKKEKSNKNNLVIMMTGRKKVVEKEVMNVLSMKGLKFDDYLFNDGGETLNFKIREIEKALKYNPGIREVEFWDDRTAHIPTFQKLADELVEKGYLDSFKINHVKGGALEEFILKESLDSKKMKKIIRTDYALLDILDSTEASGSDWGVGGCWILADALSEYYNAPLYVVYNSEMNRIEHFMVKIGELFMDSDGLQKGNQVINTMKEGGVYVKDINNLKILPYSSDMNSDVIVRDIAASKKLVDLFKKESLNESKNMTEEFDKDYKSWKRKNVTIRGVREMGQENNAGAMLGSGLYSAALSNRELAKKYGKVFFVIGAIPKSPKAFNTLNEWEIWFYNTLVSQFSKEKGKEFPDKRDFNASTTIEAEMQKLGYDGIIIKGREMVNFTPGEVLYFATENELYEYFNNNIRIREMVHEILSTMDEASIGPGGELIDFDTKFLYPYDEIWNMIKYYVRENEKRWMQFGWIVSDAQFPSDKYRSYNDQGTFFKVEKIDDFAGGWDMPILDILNSDEDAYERAKKAGFILDDDGIVLGLNGDNLVDQVN